MQDWKELPHGSAPDPTLSDGESVKNLTSGMETANTLTKGSLEKKGNKSLMEAHDSAK